MSEEFDSRKDSQSTKFQRKLQIFVKLSFRELCDSKLSGLHAMLRTCYATYMLRTETISYRGPQLWNLIPDNIKSEPSLELFKKKIRKWKCEPCPCRMCKIYLQHIGFIS